MKTTKIICFFALAGMLVFSSCFNSWEGELATITLNLNGSDSARGVSALDAVTLGRLAHTVTLKGPAGTSFSKDISAGERSVVFAALVPGKWTITVQAFLDKNLYATGNKSIKITAGQNAVTIPMHVGGELATELGRLKDNVDNDGEYPFKINADETITPKTLSYNKKNVTITIEGGNNNPTLTLAGNGSMFTVEAGVTLILKGNITLKGHSNNTAALITVKTGGALELLEISGGVTITGNGNNTSSVDKNRKNDGMGGGVSVEAGGTFTMKGGTISLNTAAAGGGVRIAEDGTFTMSGGEISGNTARDSISNGHSSGGGVHVYGGTFYMEGGNIFGNTAYSHGGGLYVGNSYFKKTGGIIYGYGNEPWNKVDDRSKQVRKGHAIYSSYGASVEVRDTTSNEDDELTFDGAKQSPEWSGAWED